MAGKQKVRVRSTCLMEHKAFGTQPVTLVFNQVIEADAAQLKAMDDANVAYFIVEEKDAPEREVEPQAEGKGKG